MQKAKKAASGRRSKSAKPAPAQKKTVKVTKSKRQESASPSREKQIEELKKPATKAKKVASTKAKSKSPAKAKSEKDGVQSWVAFIDTRKVKKANHENFDTFKLGLVEKELKDGYSVKVYEPMNDSSQHDYTLEKDRNVKISAYQVITHVKVKANKDGWYRMAKNEFNKVNKLLESTVESVKKQLGLDSDEEDSSSSEDQQESKEQKQAPQSRRIVKAKRSEDTTQNQKKKREPVEEKQMIDTSVKGKKGKGKNKKEDSEDEEQDLPKVGVKRKTRPNPSSDDQQVEESTKVKRKGDGTQETKVVKVKAPAKKKVVKKPTVFKSGKWNPDTVLLEQDDDLEDPSKEPIYNCSHLNNSRNVFRAINNNDVNLLKKLVYDKENVLNLHVPEPGQQNIYPRFDLTPLQLIMKKGNLKMLETFLHIKHPKQAHMNRAQQDQEFYVNSRTPAKPFLLHKVQQGTVSERAYGARIRTVEMTRGNRQGNNAFIEQQIHANVPMFNFWQESSAAEYTIPVWEAYLKIKGQTFLDTGAQLREFFRKGITNFPIKVIEEQQKLDNYGWNKLHLDVLTLDKLTEKYATISIGKKCNTQQNITPVHLACLNPSTDVLKALLDQAPDFQMQDTSLSKPIHYAAACKTSGPLKLLLELGANVHDLDNMKRTALHWAAYAGRTENVKLLLETQPTLWKLRDKRSMTAMAWACKNNHTETIIAMLETKIVKVGQGLGPERLVPLSWACVNNNYDLAKTLIEEFKARVHAKDKFKRVPLHHAAKHGRAKIASLLLQYGTEWDFNDSSSNTPLHYAAGFGQLQIADLLLQHGADVNAENMWKTTPINIAMLMNKVGMVKRLLQIEGVDVNGKDEKGRTLLGLTIYDLEDEKMVEFAEFLLEKGADPNIPDTRGNTMLHNLASFQPLNNQTAKKERQNQLKMIDLIIRYNGDLSALNHAKESPFTLAMKKDDIQVLEKVSSKVLVSENPKLLFEFCDKVCDDRYKSFLIKILDREPNIEAEKFNVLDSNGFSPYLAYIKDFVEKKSRQHYKNMVKMSLIKQIMVRQGRDLDRIEMQNSDIFHEKEDQLGSLSSHGRYSPHLDAWGQYCSNEKMQELLKEHMSKLIYKPFIEFLTLLIDRGADPKACVDKLEFYRELDEHKKHVVLTENQRQGMAIAAGENQAQMIDTSNRQQKAREPKSRNEVLREQKIEKGGKNKNKSQRKKISQELKEFYSKKAFTPSYYKDKEGIEHEIEYDKKYGKQNAVHLLMDSPNLDLLMFFIDQQKISYDDVDFQERNPFMINAKVKSSRRFSSSMQYLLTLGVNFDLSDNQGSTPTLLYYGAKNFQNANDLLQRGANINHIDKGGLTVLTYATIRRDNDEIERLVKAGADINKVNHKGRNLLHVSINMSSASADATFETEQLLIELGININAKDNKLRTPLHYAFVKIGKWQESTQIDPIEQVSSLCGCRGLELDEPDKWQKTPLHYAAQRGASISTLYIVQRGAQLENKDIYGNTALGVAMLNSHFNYCILLIQRGSKVAMEVTDEYPRHLEYQWHVQAKEKRRQEGLESEEDVIMEDQDELGRDQNKNQAHRKLFTQKVKQRNFYDSEDEDEYNSESDSEDSEDMANNRADQVFNQQSAFNTGFAKKAAPMKKVTKAYMGGKGVSSQAVNQTTGTPKKNQKIINPGKLTKRVRSTFRIAIQSVQQGLAYMILDNGYDYMLAMQDAMDETKFQLVITLLSKTADDSKVCQKNEQGQTLLHILCKNANKCQQHHLERIYNTLKKRGIDAQAIDNHKCSALHYAVQSDTYHLVRLLLTEGLPVNAINSNKHSPLSLYLSKRNCLKQELAPAFGQNVFQLLLDAHADVNVLFPDKRFHKDPLDAKNAYLEELKQQENIKGSDLAQVQEERPENMYHCTPIILLCRQVQMCEEPITSIFHQNLQRNMNLLLSKGAKLDKLDSEERSALSYAAMSNDKILVQSLISAFKSNNFDVNSVDLNGKSVAHFIVNPVPFGSYENDKLLAMVHQNLKIDVDMVDNQEKTPLDYALQQSSGVLAKELQKILGVNKIDQQSIETEEFLPLEQWQKPQFDFNEDSHALIESAEEKKKAELMEEDSEEKYKYVPVDVVIPKDEIQYKVYYTSEGKPYDAYMTKVDLRNGPWGDYVFYKIQLLHDTNRGLYIVLTRYGRIGEIGMNQRSPFAKIEDALNEFHTIFKQKSSNDFTDLDNFVPANKKYSIVQVHYSQVKHKDYLAPFDFENCPAATIVNNQVRQLVEEISNVTMFQRAVSHMGLDQDLMPISMLKKHTIDEAMGFLKEIAGLIKENAKLGEKGMQADMQEVSRVKNEISKFSSKFYTLVPFTEQKNQLIKPISNQNTLKQRFDQIDSLTGIEYSSRILLGALHRQLEFNPMDYIYQNLNTKIELMERGLPETELIHKYISSTSDDPSRKFRVFRIERMGEGEKFQNFKHLDNRRLLFHGSQMSNFLGIMGQGLRIAPPEAPTTGYMFGKGVYFADLFRKAQAYAQSYSRGMGQSNVLLICEVALGKMKKLREAQYIENLESEYQSVMGLGSQGPDYKNKKIITPNGYSITPGPIIDNPVPENWEAQWKAEQEKKKDQQPQTSAFNRGFGGGGFGGGGFGGFGGGFGGYGRNANYVPPYYTLSNNEFIVYNTDQVKMRYMVQFM